jgi:serine-type D-Ala-D-Ala carboxypeptidase (penicillin-binding protein 5/6)
VRRRRTLLGLALALALAPVLGLALALAPVLGPRVLVAAGDVFGHGARIPGGLPPLGAPVTHHARRWGAWWPQQGQAALVLGDGRAQASARQQPVPIASVAKVMTAYLTLKRHPLSATQNGFSTTVTAAEAQAEARDRAEGQSVVAVRAGERLTERQLLEALLIPSGNNIAAMLAVRVAGSESRFISEMNEQARALGMDHTTYTDPSGFAASTVSTAADQLRVLRQAMGLPLFRQIVSMADVTLPVAGTLRNYDPLIAEGYAGKTGSDVAARGCLAFFTTAAVDGRRLTAAGVVLGQGEGEDTEGLLAAAGAAAEQLVRSAVRSAGMHT